MITIAGLTDRQRNIMELLWTCESMEDVQTLISALPTEQDQNDARGLVLIATWESLEEELGLEQYREAADSIIGRCR